MVTLPLAGTVAKVVVAMLASTVVMVHGGNGGGDHTSRHGGDGGNSAAGGHGRHGGYGGGSGDGQHGDSGGKIYSKRRHELCKLYLYYLAELHLKSMLHFGQTPLILLHRTVACI